MNGELPPELVGLLSQGALSTLLLEGIKWLIRQITKQPDFDFAPKFYLVMIPFLNVLMIVPLALLQLPGYAMPTDWLSFGRLAVITVLASLISVGGYQMGIKPLKNYAVQYKLAKQQKL